MRSMAVLVILGVLVTPVLTIAQSISSVSGTIEDKSEITINGDGFGSKAHAAPLRWLDFDSGNIGNVINEQGWSTSYDSDSWCYPEYTMLNSRDGTANGQFCGTGALEGYEYQYMRAGTILTGRKIYLRGSIWFDWGTNGPPDPGTTTQVKTFRFHTGGGYELKPWVGAQDTWADSGIEARLTYRPENCGGDHSYQYHSAFQNHQWNDFHVVLDKGTVNGGNGSLEMMLNYAIRNEGFQNFSFECSGDNMDNFILGNYLGNVPLNETNRVHYDDVYLDDTWQRVEVGNSPNYGSCTRREIQIPTFWQDGVIKVTANIGKFSPDDTAYLFVIDENDNPSQGFEIQWGGEIQASSPGQPGQPERNE